MYEWTLIRINPHSFLILSHSLWNPSSQNAPVPIHLPLEPFFFPACSRPFLSYLFPLPLETFFSTCPSIQVCGVCFNKGLHVHEYGFICWSMVNLTMATSLKKIHLGSPSSD